MIEKKSAKNYKAYVTTDVHDKHLLTIVVFAIEPVRYKRFPVDRKVFNGKIQTWNKDSTKIENEERNN